MWNCEDLPLRIKQMQEKPFSQACERNQKPILEVLKQIIKADDKQLLELGSGTGQHAAYLAEKFPALKWHCSDLRENHAGIEMWTKEITNIEPPITYKVGETEFPRRDFDLVFTANTFHIMSWELCQKFICDCGEHLQSGSKVIIYGPFNYDGQYSSESNAQFDIWLKKRSELSAIRDFERVCKAFEELGFNLVKDFAMPANNRTLVFAKL